MDNLWEDFVEELRDSCWEVFRVSGLSLVGSADLYGDLLARYERDGAGYLLLRGAGEESEIERDGIHNRDLVLVLANLANRTLELIWGVFGGYLPLPGVEDRLSRNLREDVESLYPASCEFLSRGDLEGFFKAVWGLLYRSDAYLDRACPWESDFSGSRPAPETVLYTQAEVLRLLAGLLRPFLPKFSITMLASLGYSGSLCPSERDFFSWGILEAGTKVSRRESFFPRVAERKITGGDTMSEKEAEKVAEEEKEKLLSINKFAELKLRVGQIIEAERIEKSDKLVRMQVDLGPESGSRQIVAGIAKYYPAEELIGRKIIVVANLKPAKLMGVESQGMLLAASDDEGALELVSVGAGIKPGAVVR